MKPRHTDLIALSIASLGALACGYVAERVYERIPHIEDEFAVLWEAEVMAQGDIWRPSPEFESSFLVPFVVDHEGRRFGKYPPGWPAALSLGARLNVEGWVNPLLAGLCLWLVYRLARKVLNPGLSVFAQLLTLSSPMFLMLSGTLMAHTLSFFLALAFMLAWSDLLIVEPTKTRSPAWLLILVAGSSIGLLLLTRPLTALAVAAPFAILQGFQLLRRRNGDWMPLLSITLLAASIAALLPVWQWALTGDAFTNPYTLWWAYDRIGFGPGVGVTDSGHNLFWAYSNTRFSLRAGVHDLFGWPYLSWLLIPFGLIGLYRKKVAWLHLGTTVSLILAYALYWIGSWLFGPRYYFEALAGLSILSAGGFGWLGGWLSTNQRAVRWRRPISLAIIATCVMTNLIFYLPARLGGMKGLYQIDRHTAVRFVVKHPESSLILIKTPHWFLYARYLYQVEPFTSSPLLVAWSRGPETDDALMSAYPDRSIYYYDVSTGELQGWRPPLADPGAPTRSGMRCTTNLIRVGFHCRGANSSG